MLVRRAHVITGAGSDLGTADLLIRDGRIARISADPIDAPDDEPVIDAAGRTVMPGLIDAHLHIDFLGATNGLSGWRRARRHRQTLDELLRSGITSVRTMADPLAQILWLRKRSGSPRCPGPRLVVAGPAITAPGGHPQITVCRDNPWLQKHMVRVVEDEEQARSVVRSLHEAGVDLIKIVFQGGVYAEFGDRLNKLTLDAARGAIEEAHARGLTVSAHTHYQPDVDLLLGLGIDSIEHGVIEDRIDDGDGFLQRWADSGVPPVSTLTIAQLVRDRSGRQYLEVAGENLRRAHEAGVRIVAGTDSLVGAMTAGSLHDELRLMVEAGLPPSAVIRAATQNAAELLGLPDRGRVEEGATADLLVLNSDPLEDIDAASDISMVIQGGRIVHRAEQRAPVELRPYTVPDEPVEHYLDGTRGAVDHDVRLEVDSSRFGTDGLRTLTYTDPDTGATLRTETLRSDPKLLTREWTCRIPGDGTDVTARLAGRRIELTGTFRGQQVTRGYPLGGSRWMQGMVFDAAGFVTGPGRVLDFLAIGTTGRGALEASGFELTVDARTAEEVTATLVMPRWRRFWSARVRFDAATGELTRYEVTGKENAALRRVAPAGGENTI